MPDLTFLVIPHHQAPPKGRPSTAHLLADNWDDWFTFETQYKLVVFDQAGVRHEVGYTKIGQFTMPTGARSAAIPGEFDLLEEEYFSLGQDESYYSNLNALGGETRDLVLSALRDLAFEAELFDRAKEEKVTRRSLMRFVPEATVTGQFRRLASGGARLTSYEFSYRLPRRLADTAPPTMDFVVIPESQPPTNVHVIIGRNGVGKTHILSHMARSLCAEPASARRFGRFTYAAVEEAEEERFTNLVSVSFSAFDEFELIGDRKTTPSGMRFTYVGLRRTTETGKGFGTPKSPDMLAREFVSSMRICQNGARLPRWRHTLGVLERDAIFHEAGVSSWADYSGDEGEKTAASLFGRLSSGHKIVLLTMTRLVQAVEERTLVLIDEPEAHLHPPLLSAFIRALSDLLVTRNGVAIVATHSPVVLQEVPKRCVWKLRRSGHEVEAKRPEVETFGENVGVLTREAFGLEVTQTGFHSLLREVADDLSFEQAREVFEDQLGSEALALLRVMVDAREDEENDEDGDEDEDE